MEEIVKRMTSVNKNITYELPFPIKVETEQSEEDVLIDIFKELLPFIDEISKLQKELGIDIITLFKAIKQGYIYKKLDDGSIVKVDIDMLNFEEGFKCAIFSKTYAEGNYKQCYKMDTYINSKNWALTKEELENDNL